jgi:hypothetical protein
VDGPGALPAVADTELGGGALPLMLLLLVAASVELVADTGHFSEVVANKTGFEFAML